MKVTEQRKLTNEWRQFFENQNIEQEDISLYIEYISVLIRNNVPPIFDFQHLCKLLGIKSEDLAKMANAPDSYYHSFDIPKRSGGKRTISAPLPSLRHVQSWIYKNILINVKVHGCAHGFIEKKSIVTNASIHLGQKYLLKIDLKDFFPTIKKNWVIQVFKNLGYEHSIACLLASLCCRNECLPQGSPTSPIISNIVAIHLDRRLYRVAKRFNLRYTRYADDIAFSGEMIPAKYITYVRDIITDCGFVVNDDKVKLYGEHGNKILTGISLSNGTMRIPRDYRRNLKKLVHYIKKYGIDAHIKHNNIRDAHYIESLAGKAAFWELVEPDNSQARDFHEFLTEILRSQRISARYGCTTNTINITKKDY